MKLSFSSIVKKIKYKNCSNEAVSTDFVFFSKSSKLSPSTVYGVVRDKI